MGLSRYSRFFRGFGASGRTQPGAIQPNLQYHRGRVVCHNLERPALTLSFLDLRTIYMLHVGMLRKLFFTCKNLNFEIDEVRTGFPRLGHTALVLNSTFLAK